MDSNIKSILVVNPEEGVRRKFVEFFGTFGYEVLAVGSAREAISTVITRKVDVLILNMDLPELDGCDVAPIIRKIDPHVRVILTLEDDPEEREVETVQTEQFECWTQPLNMEGLLRSIQGERSADPQDGFSPTLSTQPHGSGATESE